MRTVFRLIAGAALICMLHACKKDAEPTGITGPVAELPEGITRDRTLHSDTTYLLTGNLSVSNNAILTIEPGTVIKLKPGANNASSILIARGSKIMAEGTADKPIVFTSGNPPGERIHGEWGGLYIFGDAPVSAYDELTGGAATELKIPYISNEFTGGGNDPNDNSGVLKYVRIEFGGSAGGTNYGLGCIGVGAGTVIEHVQCSYSGASGFGFYGGTVNARHLVTFSDRLAGFVYANGYKGKQQFIVSYKHPYFANAGSWISTCDAVLTVNDILTYPLIESTRPVISNLTAIGPYNHPGYNPSQPWNAAVNVINGSSLALRNSVLVGMPKGGIKFSDDAAALHLQSGVTTFSNNLVHSNVPEDAFTLDPNVVYSIDTAVLNEYARSHNNTRFDRPEGLQLSDPFRFGAPGLLPKPGSVALAGADFSGPDYDDFFQPVTYRGAFGDVNWMAGWTNFYPVETGY